MSRRLWLVFVLMLSVGVAFAQSTPISLSAIQDLKLHALYGMGAARNFALSADETRFAVAMGFGGVRVYTADDFTAPLKVFGMQNQDARAVAFSPDGSRIAVGYATGIVAVYDGVNFNQQWALEAHTDNALALVFSPDGTRLLTGSWDQSARVWDVATNQLLLTLILDSQGTSVAFSPDGTRIVAGSRGAHLFDATNGARLADLNTHTNLIADIAFSPDGATLATASEDLTIKLWDGVTGAEKSTLVGLDAAPRAIAFDPSAPTHLLSSDEKSTLRRWDITTGQTVQRIPTRGVFGALYPLAEGGLLAGSVDVGAIRLDDTLTDLLLPTEIRSAITAMALAPDGRLAVGYRTGEIDLVLPVENESETLLASEYNALGEIRDLAYTPDFTHLVVAYSEDILRVYETAEYTLVAEVETPKSFTQLVIDAQSGRVGVYGRWTAVYSLPDLDLLADLSLDTSTNGLAFSPDGSQLAISHRIENVKLFDGITYAPLNISVVGPLKPEYGITGLVSDMRYIPDGTGLLVSWNHYTSGIYDVQTGAAIHETDLKNDLAQVIVVAPDASFMLFLDVSEINVMRWEGLELVGEFTKAYQGSAIDGVFSPDATYLYTLSQESFIRVWAIRE